MNVFFVYFFIFLDWSKKNYQSDKNLEGNTISFVREKSSIKLIKSEIFNCMYNYIAKKWYGLYILF